MRVCLCLKQTGIRDLLFIFGFGGVDARFRSITFFLRAKPSPITIVWYVSKRMKCKRWIKCIFQIDKRVRVLYSCSCTRLNAVVCYVCLSVCQMCICESMCVCVRMYVSRFVLYHHGLTVCMLVSFSIRILRTRI